MAIESFLNKIKNFFTETKKIQKDSSNIIKYEKKLNQKIDNKEEERISQAKELINDIISGKTKSKEEIIKALKQCEKAYFDEGKQLEIIISIGKIQNDPEILTTFIDETAKYTRFDEGKHYQIRKSRNEAQKKLNEIILEEIINTKTNTYANKNNIIKILNSIKNDQLLFENKEEEQNNIIKIFNNIEEDLYNDITVIEALFQVFDIKMKNINPEIKEITNNLKKKINTYYNTEGTKEEKNNAIKQIKINKIKEENKENIENLEKSDDIENTKVEEPKEITEEENDEYQSVNYSEMLSNEEERINNASNLTEEEKKKLIEELYEDFEAYVGEENIHTR